MTADTPSRDDLDTLVESSPDLVLASTPRARGDDRERAVLRPGDTIDHFAIDELVDSGGMGAVYRARDLRLEREVAIKLVHEDMLERPEIRAAFATEARAMARVHHANVVTIHAFGEHFGRPYLVMEYVHGSNLTRWCEEHPDATLRERLAILDALCCGVEAIHAAGALHRDLKPGNVLIANDGRVVITDFGLACAETSSTPARRLVGGTPAYVAPEIAREAIVEPALARRSDVYALGVIAFELLTGTRLFDADAAGAVRRGHASALLPLASRIAPGLPPAFDEVLLRALAEAPVDRTRSAEQLRRDLAGALATSEAMARRRRFLVADDEVSSLLALRELLLAAFPGAEVIPVTSTQTAVAIAMRDLPDVVITDLAMPDGGGEVLIRALRSDPRTTDVPIIVVTGFGGTAEWHALRSLGADRFLTKPVDFDALTAMIRAVLRTVEAPATPAPPEPASHHA